MELNVRKLLLIQIVGLFFFSCDQPKTANAPVEKTQEHYSPLDTIKFPYKRVNMTLDSSSSIIKVSYGHVPCECAQWATTGGEYIYVEPANSKLTNAENLFPKYWKIDLQLTGKFYKVPGYPIGYIPGKGLPDPAKVFRYNKIKIIKLEYDPTERRTVSQH